MIDLGGKRVVVLGRDGSGAAAVALVRARGGTAVWLETTATSLGDSAEGIENPDLVIVSAGCETTPSLARMAAARGVTVIGERELAFQCSLCLHVAITGGSGKSTTARLIAEILRGSGRRVEIADPAVHPASTLVESTRELDFLIHVVHPWEAEHFVYFRPVVAVWLNIASGESGTVASRAEDVRRTARLFAAQQAFDWAIVQSAALAQLRAVGVDMPGKLITFSSESRQADLREERGLLLSGMEGWSGPLWDLSRGRMRGPHFAEDALAALAVGRVLRLTLEQMLPALAAFEPGPGRMEILGEANGVRWVDDSRASTLDALARALLTLAPTPPERPFIWLIAGGESAGRQFYDLGPLLSPRVRQAFVFGEAAIAMRTAWSLFVPCSPVPSLLDAIHGAGAQIEPGDVILFSPACSSRESAMGLPSTRPTFRELVLPRLSTGPNPVSSG